MTPLTIAVAALIAGLLFGTIFVLGTPVFAIPLALAVLALLAALRWSRRLREARSMAEHRAHAESEPVEFSDRDHETLV